MVFVKASAAVSHVGKVRSNNQDSGYAGKHLYLVADGMGGHAGGDIASSIATRHISANDIEHENAEIARKELSEALTSANRQLIATVLEHNELTGMGTTVSAIELIGSTMVIAHIGDSRVYLLRAGELSQITVDHTFVQRLVDSGRITADQAMVHPRRSVLMRVLGDVETTPEVDTMLVETHAGDRWMLCSDGLSGVVPFDKIHSLMTLEPGAKQAADKLVRQALDGGAPDNVTVVVVDIDDRGGPEKPAQFVGSAANPLVFNTTNETGRQRIKMPRVRNHPVRESEYSPTSSTLDEILIEDARRRLRRRFFLTAWILLVIACLTAVTLVGYRWTQQRYYVGELNGRVAIYKGVQQNIGPFSLHSVNSETTLDLGSLRPYDAQRVQQTINAGSLDEARRIVARLEDSLVPEPDTATPTPTLTPENPIAPTGGTQ